MSSEKLLVAPGDHLLRRADGGWQVFLVQDVVALRRLLPLERDGEIVDLVEETPDSVQPAYAGEPYALARAFATEFDSRDAAREAIESRALGEARHDVCMSLESLADETTEIVRRPRP